MKPKIQCVRVFLPALAATTLLSPHPEKTLSAQPYQDAPEQGYDPIAAV